LQGGQSLSKEEINKIGADNLRRAMEKPEDYLKSKGQPWAWSDLATLEKSPPNEEELETAFERILTKEIPPNPESESRKQLAKEAASNLAAKVISKENLKDLITKPKEEFVREAVEGLFEQNWGQAVEVSELQNKKNEIVTVLTNYITTGKTEEVKKVLVETLISDLSQSDPDTPSAMNPEEVVEREVGVMSVVAAVEALYKPEVYVARKKNIELYVQYNNLQKEIKSINREPDDKQRQLEEEISSLQDELQRITRGKNQENPTVEEIAKQNKILGEMNKKAKDLLDIILSPKPEVTGASSDIQPRVGSSAGTARESVASSERLRPANVADSSAATQTSGTGSSAAGRDTVSIEEDNTRLRGINPEIRRQVEGELGSARSSQRSSALAASSQSSGEASQAAGSATGENRVADQAERVGKEGARGAGAVAQTRIGSASGAGQSPLSGAQLLKSEVQESGSSRKASAQGAAFAGGSVPAFAAAPAGANSESIPYSANGLSSRYGQGGGTSSLSSIGSQEVGSTTEAYKEDAESEVAKNILANIETAVIGPTADEEATVVDEVGNASEQDLPGLMPQVLSARGSGETASQIKSNISESPIQVTVRASPQASKPGESEFGSTASIDLNGPNPSAFRFDQIAQADSATKSLSQVNAATSGISAIPVKPGSDKAANETRMGGFKSPSGANSGAASEMPADTASTFGGPTSVKWVGDMKNMTQNPITPTSRLSATSVLEDSEVTQPPVMELAPLFRRSTSTFGGPTSVAGLSDPGSLAQNNTLAQLLGPELTPRQQAQSNPGGLEEALAGPDSINITTVAPRAPLIGGPLPSGAPAPFPAPYVSGLDLSGTKGASGPISSSSKTSGYYYV
jgi:hypothetical protein